MEGYVYYYIWMLSVGKNFFFAQIPSGILLDSLMRRERMRIK